MIKFKTIYRKTISDRITPVGMYLNIRDRFPMAFLLESSDYHGQENSFSYICFDPLAKFQVSGTAIKKLVPGFEEEVIRVQNPRQVLEELNIFKTSFSYNKQSAKCIQHGLFGYMAYDAVNYFEDISVKAAPDLPSIDYRVFRYVIAIDHFHNEMHIFEHLLGGQLSEIDTIFNIIVRRDDPVFSFTKTGSEESFTTDEEYLSMVQSGIEHCHRGDVFQIVLSRRFATRFKGDDFNVYRALRSVNPSPYLFYFDYGNFRICGSSPEAQLVVNDKTASIFPIAGTFRRTGNDSQDTALAEQLKTDRKENAEHVMLVDLARNDLSRCAEDVKVDVFKEVQRFSHVIHLVSKVTGRLSDEDQTIPLAAATFPAGTLSGAPKYKAMQLIDEYETLPRGYYGGAAGFMSFDGDFNHAIMIRSFLSKGNTLYYQAGAGVVAKSDPQSELQEVNNKLDALRNALELAEEINNGKNENFSNR